MILNQPSTKLSPLPKWSSLALAVIGFIGFADAAYLAADHYLALPLPCSLTQGCDTVLRSSYATIGPVPIALFGAAYYLVVLFLAVSIYTSASENGYLMRLICAITGVGVLVSGILVYLQIFIIHALCMYCLGSVATSVLLFGISLYTVAIYQEQAA